MTARSVRRTRLAVESLESRMTPTADWAVDSFDGNVSGSTPNQWHAWGSDGNSGFGVTSVRAIGTGALASAGGSTRTSRTWRMADYPRDVRVAASVYADTLVPAQVFARGRGLDGERPTYYAVSLARGLDVKLIRVVNGTRTELASLRTTAYASGLWVDVSLTTQGNAIQARIRRRDTGQWLNPFGNWQVEPAAALSATDAAIASSGRVGLARPAAYAGPVYFDEVRVGPPAEDLTPPAVTAAVRTLSTAVAPGTVAGLVRFYGRVHEANDVNRVEFFVDGDLASTRSGRSPSVDFDSRNLANGRHTLTVRAWDAAGNVGEATASFIVRNTTSVRVPIIPRHYDHIRFAALAYNSLAIGPRERELLRESIDLVVPNARYLQEIDATAPATPQLIYSNVSNLYLELLTDWLGYADRHGVDRESAFYHVAEPTPFTGASPSSQPVNWLWNVQRGSSTGATGFVKLTSETRSGTTPDVPFGGAGESLYLGYPERFREINVWLARIAGDGWTGLIEYASRVDGAGRPVAWKNLPMVANTTANFRRSGVITFDPPADWKPAIVPGSSSRLFYLRIRTSSGDAASTPIASAILGRNYVQAKVAWSGTIPAFDGQADVDGNGYLNDAEYARRRPGFNARFEYESRLFYPNYGQMRFVTNPAGKGVAAWAAAYHRQLLNRNPLADGVFMDNSGGQAPFDGADLIEPADAYGWEYAALLGAINRGIAPKWVLANTSGGGASADRVARQSPATIEEFALRPMAHNWMQFHDLSAMVDRRLSIAPSGGFLILDSLSTGGSPVDPRTQMAALAYYYLLAKPDSTFFMTWGGEEPASAWDRHWFDAIAFDVGRPSGRWSEFAAGSDPSNRELMYRVYQRPYENALVLHKPLSYSAGKGTGGTTDAAATTHQLPGRYRLLNADGSLGPPTSAVTLRNGEGAILVPVS
jgi:hypothetical protein